MKAHIVLASLGALLVSGCVGSGPGMPGGRFQRDFMGIDNATIEEARGVFENRGMPEIGEYCNRSRFTCGYYCRAINPEHEFCGQFNSTFRRLLR